MNVFKVLSIFLLACSLSAQAETVTGEAASTAASRKTVVTAAGATLPLPFYNEAFALYWEKHDVPVTYAGIGTERGLQALQRRQIDFAGVDVLPTKAERDGMPGRVIALPTCMGAVTVAYNLKGADNLRLTGQLLADIFMGRIVKWNDARIATINPNIALPDREITPVFRLDGSGTTHVFSQYLSKVSAAWKTAMGVGKKIGFSVGVGANGNQGVAQLVERIPGSIGYVATEYTSAFDTQRAWLRNAAGQYVQPTQESIMAAGAASGSGGASIESAMADITNATDAAAYPMSCYTWVLVYEEQNYAGRSYNDARETANVLRWLISPEAQELTTRLLYSPLPLSVSAVAARAIDGMTFDGKSIK